MNVVWLAFTHSIIPVLHNGKTIVSALSSSTCSIVQSLHALIAKISGPMSVHGTSLEQDPCAP
ncbi:hypothetical protein SLEP1_g21104 [Rubroshorea leprosula]|uniref:Uncharacterized protein n=1 Tax=Rubroshorea leprosula TaxID=152421 RepID=A0AAV5JE52_9ROSI|nr:hypothetical protein SLEP1_g21104 [Rubroshorea leprosula]